MLQAQPYVMAPRKSHLVRVTDPSLIHKCKAFVGFMGPPGSAKSTTCNTVLYAKFGDSARVQFFEPSESATSFTKGLWVLSPAARMRLSGPIDYEVVDMEGFEPDKERCHKLAMVMCVLCEVIVFCNRDARYDSLVKAAKVLGKGIKLSTELGMRPVTTQIFVQVRPIHLHNQGEIDNIVGMCRKYIPDKTIVPFCLPEVCPPLPITLEEVTFNPELVAAVKVNLVDKFRFATNSQAAAAKSDAVSELLEAFNNKDFVKLASCNERFFEADCKRIFEQELCEYRKYHTQQSLQRLLTGVDMTLEQFVGDVDRSIKPKFSESAFYVQGKSEELVAKWYTGIVEIDVVIDCYRPQFAICIANLKAEEEKKRAQEELEKAEEESRRAQEKLRKAEEANKRAEEERRKAAEEEQRAREERRKAEEAEKRAREERKKAAEEEQRAREERRKAAEEKQRAKEERRKAAEEEQRAKEERRKAEEAEKRAREKRRKEAEEAERRAQAELEKFRFLKLVEDINAAAKTALEEYINRQKFRETYVPPRSTFIAMKSLKELQSRTKLEPDFSPFYACYESECKKLVDKWDDQIKRAQWKEPVQAYGEMKCEGGHNLSQDVVCHCIGPLFWVDGPTSHTKCQRCGTIDVIGKALVCAGCGRPSLCQTRSSSYVP